MASEKYIATVSPLLSLLAPQLSFDFFYPSLSEAYLCFKS